MGAAGILCTGGALREQYDRAARNQIANDLSFSIRGLLVPQLLVFPVLLTGLSQAQYVLLTLSQ